MIFIVLAVVVLAGLIITAVLFDRERQRRALRDHFGSEYTRAVQTAGSQRQAEQELKDRFEQRDKLTIQPLGAAQRDRYEQEWRYVQAAFVDEPDQALAEADSLVTSVMAQRGYPMEDFDEQADFVSVDYPQVVGYYRDGHGIYMASQSGEVGTEQLRRAFVSYRSLFLELVEEGREHIGTTSVASQSVGSLNQRSCVGYRHPEEGNKMSHYEDTYQSNGTTFDQTAHGTEAPLDQSISQLPGRSRHKRPGPPSRDNINVAPLKSANGSASTKAKTGHRSCATPTALLKRWESVQVGFVDNPRQAVGEAESLVSSAIDEIVSGFRRQSARLEAEWSQGHDASTDELRLAFRRYREFFGRLLEV